MSHRDKKNYQAIAFLSITITSCVFCRYLWGEAETYMGYRNHVCRSCPSFYVHHRPAIAPAIAHCVAKNVHKFTFEYLSQSNITRFVIIYDKILSKLCIQNLKIFYLTWNLSLLTIHDLVKHKQLFPCMAHSVVQSFYGRNISFIPC